MGSRVPIDTIEEDEEFDWEAAVKEIDLACLKTSIPPPPSSSSSSSHFTPLAHPPITGNGTKPPAKRQSTLDRFIGRTENKPENQVVSEPNFECGNDNSPLVGIDPETAKTWIYPVNGSVPLRDYQFAITKTALFSNTLVALPTGLGKTLIAAVVMYNYFRWFPQGKIVFAAPSRPLVMQQIEACHNIVGIPQEWTIDLTGQTCPSKRAFLWKSKRVFFVTPQVLEKDIQSGTCLTKYLVCLVIDEAHRALGNYSYCVVVRELMAVPIQLRILALTATPGSKTQAIQGIIDNLQISTLEYRNESDHDVCPYVHDRKLELIEVPLGQDADDVSKRLFDVIRPYAARLKNFGVKFNRDYQTLSPHEVLMARDTFRQAPLPGLPHVNHGDVEACFSALITLYHIRKLLSSHGIRPAYEMLEEKLREGPFARLMSKNEDIWKTKLLMQQRLSHGAPSPKLSKMLEILVDHFKVKDPRTSRVIIFSNFRGSVRDIMDALSNIGDLVKATEFIGQSSGKTLKGQSQKVQQAVLEKFRAGGFNVIVATSIGEEGLDIMEVDLVICFDANVSPLRMIQRMGRTGRKNNGRVVVLACEGSEKNSYMRKQANGRAIKKHMRNGGTNSFNFHPSPRMIPHIYKPEVQHVKFSIKQFIPRGKKLQDEYATETPAFKKKLTSAETDMLAKYYETDEEKLRLSLIAFPHFQISPSKVHKVMHSRQTGLLIDAMQHFQEATISEQSKSFFTEFGAPLGEREEFDTGLRVGDDPKDLPSFCDWEVNTSQRNAKQIVESPTSTLETTEKDYEESSLTHRYLFSSECASVDTLGKVFVMPVPLSFFSNLPASKYMPCAQTEKQQSFLNRSHIDFGPIPIDTSTKKRQDNNISCKLRQRSSPDGANEPLETCSLVKGHSTDVGKGDVENCVGEIVLSSDEDDCEDLELSPRLTNFIKSGVVPESPVYDQGVAEEARREEDLDLPKISSPMRFSNELAEEPSFPGTNVHHKRSDYHTALKTNEVRTPQKEDCLANGTECLDVSLVPEEWRTPLANLTNTNSSASKDWRVGSGEKSETLRQPRKLKRLRRLGDCSSAVKENNPGITDANPMRSRSRSDKQIRGKKKMSVDDDARVFIDAEAEVSSGAEMSADENEDVTGDSFEDSFIDDGTMPTANTQAESGKVDMMAVYRRSLLSQSPLPARFRYLAASSPSPYSAGPLKRINESRSDSDKSLSSLRTPQTTNSESNQDAMVIGNFSVVQISSDSRKRKFSLCNSGNAPVINLESKFAAHAQATEKESFEGVRSNAGALEHNGDDDDDDAFFATLDFDAMEAQATLLLSKQRSEAKEKEHATRIPHQGKQRSDAVEKDAPSFDLGLW
ncbi:PREDICTED: ATP-dependent DNA helicase mph1-like [Camelina sativa]|uniref:ATP-dependent DNA helicase mph1-like n=1 Tax=Camelina sativa TaxID=90675 RepID=A0ABM1RK39_CAMSA|nr:PREDICTED: ATP-dependent DNA helicase mph1-like [Camelina sativa]